MTTIIPMPAIQKIRDVPLSNEQTNMATNVLDSQRLKDEKDFRSYQLMIHQQNQQHQFRQAQVQQIRIPPPLFQNHSQYMYMPQQQIFPQMPQIPQMPQMNQQFMSFYEEEEQFRPVQTQHFHEESSFPWTQPPLPEFLDPMKSIDLKLIRKTKKKDTRCYTCKPRGKVKKHMIGASSSGKFIFHHDMHKRPVIIMTPARHIENIYELTSDELPDLFKSLKEFAAFWNIDDYQLSFNMGKWQNHEHFHCKIRLSEKIIGRMRRDHFMRVKLENRYIEDT
jgi:diadenosine tetraphosphate (Ap4A) HIT family hydrolase